MSIRLEIPNGLYCDAWPSGEYACLLAGFDTVQTHQGKIQLPGAAPLYTRISVTPEFKLVGQGWPTNNPTDQPLEWLSSGGWRFYPQTAYGVSPCIYGLQGDLHVATPAQGSQGYRYVDPTTGTLYTGDETYYSSTYGLSEWSSLGDGMFVGQSATDGLDTALLWDGAIHRVIEPGRVRFIRTNRVGDNVSIAMLKENGAPSVILWMTVAELRALPPYDPPVPPIPDLTPFNHNVWVAPFMPDQDAPGSACIVVNGKDYRAVAPARCQLVLDPSSLDVATPPRERFLGIYGQDLIANNAWVCHDGPEPYPRDVLAGLVPTDLPLLECYLLATESVPQAAARWTSNLDQLLRDWPYNVGLVWQDYTQQWTVPIPRLLEAHPYLSELVNCSPRVLAVCPFAWNRADGCAGPPYIDPSGQPHYPSPILAQCVRNIAAASPGIPNGGPVKYLSYQLVNGKPTATETETLDAHSIFQASGNLYTLAGIAIGFNVSVFGATAPGGLLNFNRIPFNSADWRQQDMGDFGELKPQGNGTFAIRWPL